MNGKSEFPNRSSMRHGFGIFNNSRWSGACVTLHPASIRSVRTSGLLNAAQLSRSNRKSLRFMTLGKFQCSFWPFLRYILRNNSSAGFLWPFLPLPAPHIQVISVNATYSMEARPTVASPLFTRSQGEFIFVFNFPFMLQLLESFLIQSYGVWNWISRVPFILVGVSRWRCNFIRAQIASWTFTFRGMQATTMYDQESAESFWEFR